MLLNRLFEPLEDQRLYHYCSSDSFRAILESGKLRFSDVNMLNDASEHRWGYAIFEEAATRLIKRVGVPESVPKMSIEFFDAVDEVLSMGQLIAHPFVSCLSLEGNSLDQWRKYADDGRGYAIGFLASDLKALPISLLKVSYDYEEQVREMMVALLALHSRSPNIEIPLKGESYTDAALISTYMGALKHPSFSTEREVRCMRAIALERVGDNYKFSDQGGHGDDDDDGIFVPGEKVSFTTREGAITAYVDLPFTTPSGRCAVVEVALGPKNPSHVGNVFLYLGSLGHSQVTVRPSDLPYR